MNLYADLLFTGGAIYTADPVRSWAEAVAVRDGRILVSGGEYSLPTLTAEVVDPRSGAASPTGVPRVQRTMHAAVRRATAATSAPASMPATTVKATQNTTCGTKANVRYAIQNGSSNTRGTSA